MKKSLREQIQKDAKYLRQKQRESNRQLIQPNLTSGISVHFFSECFILEIDNSQSIDKFERQCNQLIEVDCPIQDFRYLMERIVLTMNSLQIFRNGIKIILAILPKMNLYQNSVLLEVVEQKRLLMWVEIDEDKCLQFLLYLCEHDHMWKDRMKAEMIKKFTLYVYRTNPSIHSSFLLNFLLQLLDSQSFTQDLLQNTPLLIEDWFKKEPLGATRLIRHIISRQYIDSINEIQHVAKVSTLIFNSNRSQSPILLIRYLGLLQLQPARLGWQFIFDIEFICKTLTLISWQDCWQQLSQNERVCFYRFINRFKKYTDMINSQVDVLDIIDKIRASAIEYEERYGSELALNEANDIQDMIIHS